MAITQSRISHREHLFRGAIDELHSLVAANLWTRLSGLVAIAIGLMPGALM